MAEEFQIVDIWIGQFTNNHALNAYLEEAINRDDDQPMNRFSADQGQSFYDHDFVEASFRTIATDFDSCFAMHSFAKSYLRAARDKFNRVGSNKFNTLILAFGKAINNPRSVMAPEYSLTYLGQFESQPAEPDDASIDTGPPELIHLLVNGDQPLIFNGILSRSIPVDRRGLVIGKPDGTLDAPRLDVSLLITGISSDQVHIYQDQFEQWVIEDLVGNGLTQLNNQPMSGRTFPWHGKRLSVGTLEFTWWTRPLPES